MKKLFCLLIPILGLLSCSNELQETLHMAIAMSNESISFPTTEKTKIETDISNYITKIKPGNTSTFSKASNNYSLTPYIYKGDTIMYIANYTSGWELYSADQRTPLIMASSETGSFDMNDNTMAPAFKSYLNSVAEELYQIKQMDTTEGETYGLWKTVSIQNDEVDQQMIEVAPRAAGTQPGSGYWVKTDCGRSRIHHGRIHPAVHLLSQLLNRLEAPELFKTGGLRFARQGFPRRGTIEPVGRKDCQLPVAHVRGRLLHFHAGLRRILPFNRSLFRWGLHLILPFLPVKEKGP